MSSPPAPTPSAVNAPDPSPLPQQPPPSRWMLLLRWINLDAFILPLLGFLLGSLFSDLAVDSRIWRQSHSYIIRDSEIQRVGTIYYYTKVSSAPSWLQSIPQFAFLFLVVLLVLDFWRRELRTLAEMIAIASMFVAYRSWNENIREGTRILSDVAIYESAIAEDDQQALAITDALYLLSVGNFAVAACLAVTLAVRAYEYLGGTFFQSLAKRSEAQRLEQKRNMHMGARELGDRLVGVPSQTFENGKVVTKDSVKQNGADKKKS
ncbi:hypothetical protein HDU93_009475 [Gonapodya sp. JEL0774]|nr:hypothetical protein HDU93_009475 [Gonapodya sp. JEL0774]